MGHRVPPDTGAQRAEGLPRNCARAGELVPNTGSIVSKHSQRSTGHTLTGVPLSDQPLRLPQPWQRESRQGGVREAHKKGTSEPQQLWDHHWKFIQPQLSPHLENVTQVRALPSQGEMV